MVDDGVTVTLYRSGDSARLVFDDTGVFDVSPDGRRIGWTPPPNADIEAVRKDLLGRVFAVALGQQGIITLHGSAVALGGAAVVFLAPKFHGKSTTATALVNAGGQLLADDLVPVTPEACPMVLPSVPVVQLWPDSAVRVAGGLTPAAPNQEAPKRQVAWEDAARIATTPIPLAAVYLLSPVSSDGTPEVTRERVTGVEAALALLGQTKVGALLGIEQRALLLERLVELTARAEVFRLRIPRDFQRIGELTSALLTWHPILPTAASAGEPA